MADLEGRAALEEDILALEETLSGAGQMVSSFDGELRKMQASLSTPMPAWRGYLARSARACVGPLTVWFSTE